MPAFSAINAYTDGGRRLGHRQQARAELCQTTPHGIGRNHLNTAVRAKAVDKAAAKRARRDSHGIGWNYSNTAVRAPETRARRDTHSNMAALDESMGFGFGAIGGAEQSINLGAIDWSPPPKRSHSARQMPPPRARQMPPSIVVDISPADARAAELVRQANCAVATKIKIKPGTTKPLAAVYGKLRKRWRHVDGVLVLGAGPTQHSLKYAFVSPEHSCAPTEIIAPSPVSSLGSQSARKATPRRSPRHF